MNLLKLPKIELHIHLDGSVRPHTVSEILNLDKSKIKTIKTILVFLIRIFLNWKFKIYSLLLKYYPIIVNDYTTFSYNYKL